MAFTEAQKLKIVRILGVDAITLQSALNTYGTTNITAQVETDVQAEIDRWEAGAGADFVEVHPSAANMGVKIMPDKEQNDIRRNIARMLFLADYVSFGTGMRLQRS